MEVAEVEVQRLPPEVGQVPVELVEPQVLMLEVLAVPVEVPPRLVQAVPGLRVEFPGATERLNFCRRPGVSITRDPNL